MIDSALMLAVKGERTHVLSGGNVFEFLGNYRDKPKCVDASGCMTNENKNRLFTQLSTQNH